jgi:polyisoprenoid-binding protein YceI
MLAKLALAASALATAAAFHPSDLASQEKPKTAASGRYDLDNVHTAVMFKIRHLGTSNSYGRFNQVRGSLIIDAEKPAESMVTLTIDVKSVDTNDETGVPDEAKDARDKHLRGADFFNVEEFPTIEFESTKIEPKEGGDLAITGDFTLHGVTKSLTTVAKFIGANSGVQFGSIVGYEAKLTIDRRDYGMDYAPEAIGTEVEVLISLEARKR